MSHRDPVIDTEPANVATDPDAAREWLSGLFGDAGDAYVDEAERQYGTYWGDYYESVCDLFGDFVTYLGHHPDHEPAALLAEALPAGWEAGDRVENKRLGRGTVVEPDDPDRWDMDAGDLMVDWDDHDRSPMPWTELERPEVIRVARHTLRDHDDLHVRHRDIGNGPQYCLIRRNEDTTEEELTPWYSEEEMIAFCRGVHLDL